MKPKHLFVHILAVLFAIPLAGTVAQGATIDVIETFDYPGAIGTQPQKFSDHGVIAGVFIDWQPGLRKASTVRAAASLVTRSSILTMTHF